MKRELYTKLIISAISLSLSLGIGEIVVRSYGHFDKDGNFFFKFKQLIPYNMPILTTQEKINNYLSSPSSYIMYDSLLGWSPRPNSSSQNGLYYADSNGIRVIMPNIKYSKNPKDNTLRIALFGDSYVHGDEVPYEHTWGFYLENSLKKTGINAEVINFGVGGHGTDQAFLRWKTLGKMFSPHIVILDFQPEMTKRNVNVVRPIYYPITNLIFSKPRFILEKNILKPINIPAIPPEELIDVMENIDSWDLAQYEYWLANYQKTIWQKSKLISLIVNEVPQISKLYNISDDYYFSLNEEPATITRKITEEFKRDVETSGIKFYIVYLPLKEYFQDLFEGDELPFNELLKEIEKIAYTIHPEHKLLIEAKQSKPEALFQGGHFSARANQIIADVIAASIIQKKEE